MPDRKLSALYQFCFNRQVLRFKTMSILKYEPKESLHNGNNVRRWNSYWFDYRSSQSDHLTVTSTNQMPRPMRRELRTPTDFWSSKTKNNQFVYRKCIVTILINLVSEIIDERNLIIHYFIMRGHSCTRKLPTKISLSKILVPKFSGQQ